MVEKTGSEGDLARELAGRSVAELRAAYERALALGQEISANWESLIVQGVLGLREIGDRLIRNHDVNIRALFNLAENYVQAHSPSEMCEIWQRFLEEQLERSAHQVKVIENLVSTQMRTFHAELWRGPR